MQSGYDHYPSKNNFKYFIRLQSACSYQGKLQTNYPVLTFCDFKVEGDREAGTPENRGGRWAGSGRRLSGMRESCEGGSREKNERY